MSVRQLNIHQRTIERIMERNRRRSLWHRAEKGLTLQGKAICRRIIGVTQPKGTALKEGEEKKLGSELFDKIAKLSEDAINKILADGHANRQIAMAVQETFPLIMARAMMAKHREVVEKELEELVYSLPIMEWANAIPGVGALSVAGVIGNAGNLWNYSKVQKLWKRMGMGVMFDGRRQRNIKGISVKAAKSGQEIGGYNARRRSVMWNIGMSILFSQSETKDKKTGDVKRPAGAYRILFDERRAYEDVRNERGDYAPLAAAILKSATFGKKTEAYKAYSVGRLPKAHLKARAQRFMEKRFLCEMFQAWRETMKDALPDGMTYEVHGLKRAA